MTEAISLIANARSLAGQGRIADALAMLDAGARRQIPDALFEIALWRLSGQFVPRDLPMARAYFRLAGKAGHPTAETFYIAFLANGTGGAAQWAAAIELLERRARTDPAAARQCDLIASMRIASDGTPSSVPDPVPLSGSPKVAMVRRLLTPDECAYLIEAAEPLMQPAVVVDPRTGRQVPNPIRTSDAAGFPFVHENPAIHALNRRIAAISGFPVDHGEPLQVLRYRPGQQYRLHSDALPGGSNQRVVTVLVYLSEAFTGGETYFPAPDLAVRGAPGDAILFHNVTSDGRIDERAAHAGMPVQSGVKIIVSRWIRARPLDLSGPAH